MHKPVGAFIWISFTTALVAAIAVAAMCGGIVNANPLWIDSDAFAPMKFNSAFLFVILSVGFVALICNRRKAALVCIVFTVGFSLATFLEYVCDAELAIDHVPALFFPASPMQKMTTATALCFMSLGVALLFCCQRQLKNPSAMLGATLFASIAAAVGFATVLAYLGGFEDAYEWSVFTQMPLSTAVCFVLLGSNTIVYIGKKLGGLHLWFPIPVYIGFVTISFSLAQAVRVHEEVEFIGRLQARADAIAGKGELNLENLYKALERIKERWAFQRGTSQAAWENDANNYVRDFPFITGLARTDSSSGVLWTAPAALAAKARGFQLNSEPRRAQAFSQAIRDRKAQITRRITFLGGGKGFLYINPLFVGDRFDGSLVAGIKYSDFFSMLLTRNDIQDYYVSIRDDGESLYSNIPYGVITDAHWARTAHMQNKESGWTLTLYPAQHVIAEMHSIIPWVVLGVGLLTSFLIGLSILLSLKSRQDNIELQNTGTALEASKRLSDAILASSSYLIIATDISGKVIIFNREAERELGYRADEVLHKHTPTLWHLPAELDARAQVLKSELNETLEGFEVLSRKAQLYGSEQSECAFLRKDGTTFPALLTVTPLRGAKNAVVGYLGITTNITARKKQEEALRSSEETFRSIIEHSCIGMALVSPEGRWVRVNNALCTLLGYKEEELLNTDFREITHPDDIESSVAYKRKMMQRECETYQLEKRYIHKDGHIIWVLGSASIIWNADGTPNGIIAQIQDITESKKSRQATEALVKKLAAANEELEQFAYVASHDLQEPLRMVISFTDLLREEYEDKLDADGKEYIAFATNAARRMQNMINDLLEYARIDNKAESLVMVDAEQQLHNVLANLHGVIMGMKATVSYVPIPLILGNPSRFMRLLQNLIGNALKYQPKGNLPFIHIGVEDKDGKWLFSVRDNGIGIAPEYINTIFLPFERLHNEEEYQGSGIGLAICRKIVESHGGAIWAESQPGQGSIFYFTMQKWQGRQL